MMVTAKVRFYGKVQGVWFRASTRDAADKRGVTGWVRNVEDGSVEALFQGEKNTIDDLIDWCCNHQPYARVRRHDVTWTETDEIFSEFRITR